MTSGNRKTVLLWVQQFRGVGHRVRIGRVATALEPFFRVVVLDGGPPEPKPDVPATVSWRFLTSLFRGSRGEVRPLDEGIGLEEALVERRRKIIDVIEEVHPSIFIVEFFPFARSLLADEIIAGIRRLRELNPAARVFSSVRDIPFSALEYGSNILDRDERDRLQVQVTENLQRLGFDGIFAHTDANIIDLKKYLPWLDSISVPVLTTGYVTGSGSPDDSLDRRGVVVSMGGGVDGYPLAEAVIDAWNEFRTEDIPWKYKEIFLYGGSYLPDAHREKLTARCKQAGVPWSPFSTLAREQISTAALSISRAGYNTCAELLANRTPAIVSPTIATDQELRAQVLADSGIVLRAEDKKESIYNAMKKALSFVPPEYGAKLDGAEKTAQFLIAMSDRDA